MATVTNWIDHLSAEEVVGAVYPGAGSMETTLVIIGMIGVVISYKLHYWVERKFKIDDAVGAVAVHGYAGFIGLVICGFVLNGYPASGYSVGACLLYTSPSPRD